MSSTGQKFQSDETTLDDVRGGLWGSEPTESHERSEAAIAEGRPESLNRSGLTYRTPADVRAIPHSQVERWIRDDNLPGPRFSPERWCQQVLQLVIDSAQHRLGMRTHGVKVTL